MTTRLEPVVVPDRADALRVGRAILDAHGQWEKENNQRGGQNPWSEQHVILLGQAAMLAAAPAPGGMREAIARVVQQEAEVIHNAGRRSKMYDSGALTDTILAIIAKGEGR